MNHWILLLLLLGSLWLAPAIAAEPTRVLIVVGPSAHPPGSHEVAAGGRLMKYCLEHMENRPGVTADLVDHWPHDEKLLEEVRTVVFIGDFFPPQRMPKTQTILAQLDGMMKRGCGIVCVHYATGLRRMMSPPTEITRCCGGWADSTTTITSAKTEIGRRPMSPSWPRRCCLRNRLKRNR